MSVKVTRNFGRIHHLARAVAVALPILTAGAAGAGDAEAPASTKTLAPVHAYLEAGDALGLEVYARELQEDRARVATAPADLAVPNESLLVARDPSPSVPVRPASR